MTPTGRPTTPTPQADLELVDTPRGPARLHHLPAAPGGLPLAGTTLVLGYGAGGSVTAPDLQAVAHAVTPAGGGVVLVEQPYRVAGRRSAPPAPHLDEAWLAVLEALAPRTAGGPLIVGGRSSGARVACRTARAVDATGVLCLAFPLITPKGASRQDELDEAGAPLLVVQGSSDRFGQPTADPSLSRQVVTIDGDHGLKRDHDRLVDAVLRWTTALATEQTPPTDREEDR